MTSNGVVVDKYILQLEIADLDIQESDRMYATAVRCVRTYWKQATRMTIGQRNKYVGFLKGRYKEEYLLHPSSPKSHILYKSALGRRGDFPPKNLCWARYLLLSSLYQHLPAEYVKAIEARYNTSVIEDHTDEYRRIYPEPTMNQQETTAQSITANLAQTIDLTNDEENNISEGAQLPPVSTTTKESTTPATWNIDSVIGVMSLQNKKRLCSAPESWRKRARLDGNEILGKVNQQAETIQQAMDKLQCNQDVRLQEVREAVEQNKQALDSMQSELRQFMSAVASTLRNIQERLDE